MAIAAGGGAIWIASGDNGILEKVDPRNVELTRTLNLGHQIGGIAIVGARIYLTIR
jgi:hypothetical protein